MVGELESSIAVFERALAAADENGDLLERIRFQLLLGDALIDSGNFGRAEETLGDALALGRARSTRACASISTGPSRDCTPSATTPRRPPATRGARSRPCASPRTRTARVARTSSSPTSSSIGARRGGAGHSREGLAAPRGDGKPARARPVPARGGAGPGETRAKRRGRRARHADLRDHRRRAPGGRGAQLRDSRGGLRGDGRPRPGTRAVRAGGGAPAPGVPTATSPASTPGWPSCTRPEGNADAAYET